MKKPNNFDNVSTGDFVPVELGGHHLVIKAVKESQSKNGKDMIIVAFDFAKKDKQADYFNEQFKADIRPDKKWPNGGTVYILTTDYDGNASRNFKRFITSVEKSNKGFVTEWGDRFAEQFKNLAVGAVFGVVEEEYNGEIKRRRKLRWFCSDSEADTAKIPDDKLLPNNNRTVSAPASSPFFDDGDNTDDLPF